MSAPLPEAIAPRGHWEEAQVAPSGLGSVFFWAWCGLWGFLLALLGWVMLPLFNRRLDPARRFHGALGRWWAKGILLFAPRVRVRVEGLEHLSGGPKLLVANHRSVSDTVFLFAHLPPFKFVARAGIFRIPLLGKQAAAGGHILASDEQGPERLEADCKHLFSLGCHVLMFPEGTRATTPALLRFRKGPFLVAQRAGVPVVPVAVAGTGVILPKGAWKYRFTGDVRITLLPPLTVGAELKAAAEEARARIAAELGAPRRLEAGA